MTPPVFLISALSTVTDCTGPHLDTIAPLHHGVSMPRHTINLPDDLYALARSKAIASRISISKAVADLSRRSTASSDPAGVERLGEGDPSFYIDPVTRLPVVRGDGGRVNMEDIQRSIDDEDLRHFELMGLSPKEIER